MDVLLVKMLHLVRIELKKFCVSLPRHFLQSLVNSSFLFFFNLSYFCIGRGFSVRKATKLSKLLQRRQFSLYLLQLNSHLFMLYCFFLYCWMLKWTQTVVLGSDWQNYSLLCWIIFRWTLVNTKLRLMALMFC